MPIFMPAKTGIVSMCVCTSTLVDLCMYSTEQLYTCAWSHITVLSEKIWKSRLSCFLKAMTGYNPPDITPCGVMSRGYVRQSWNLAFRTMQLTIIKRHRTLCTGSPDLEVMSWGFRPALPLTGGSDPGEVMSKRLCPPILKSIDHPFSFDCSSCSFFPPDIMCFPAWHVSEVTISYLTTNICFCRICDETFSNEYWLDRSAIGCLFSIGDICNYYLMSNCLQCSKIYRRRWRNASTPLPRVVALTIIKRERSVPNRLMAQTGRADV